ncbi:MAG: hypothetical protein ACO1Q7_10605 [Gemmatimonas sp.]
MLRQTPGRAEVGRLAQRASLTVAALLLLSGASACRYYKYDYEKDSGVGLTDRASDYCQKQAKALGYNVRTASPRTVDSPSQVDLRLRVVNDHCELIASCEFDDKKRVANIPKPQRGDLKKGVLGYMSSDASKARGVCQTAVKGAGYDVRNTNVAQWTGDRTYRVNVAVRQGGEDRNVACRFDGVPGTAVVPPVTRAP